MPMAAKCLVVRAVFENMMKPPATAIKKAFTSANVSSRIFRYGPNVIIIVLMETRGSVFRVGIKTKGEFK